MTTQNRTTTDSRDELIAKIMQTYNQLSPKKRALVLLFAKLSSEKQEMFLQKMREIVNEGHAEETKLSQTSAK